MVTVNVLRGTGMTVAISVGLLVGFRIQYELIQARDRRISERVDREVERILEERRRSAAATTSAGALK